MMWTTVVPKIIARLLADTDLVEALGGPHIYRNRTRKTTQIPGVYWKLVDEGVGENTSEVRIQWDIWANSTAVQAAIANRLYALMHKDLHWEVDGLLLWSQYVESGDVNNNQADIPEEEQGVLHIALDFIYVPGREDLRTSLF